MAQTRTQTMNQDLIEKYKEKLNQQLELKATPIYSKEYTSFRKEIMTPQMTLYENLCNAAGKILTIKINPNEKIRYQQNINTLHLQTTPEAISALSILLPTIVMVIGLTLSLTILDSLFFTIFSVIVGFAGIATLRKLPTTMAALWRMKSSNQMVLCVFYVVTYMRHTSNLERAIEFASEHLSPPLSLDLKKILWDVQNNTYENVKESIEIYLQQWRETNTEFVESFHLIESSLYETSEERRITLLDKSLDVMLSETYEKMLHYAQNLKGPITLLHMLGVVLPILGLVILPLLVSFMEGVNWYHIATLYNIVIPISVYLLGKSILSQRPTGYGDTDIAEINPELKKYRNIIIKLGSIEFTIHPMIIAITLGGISLLLAMLPLIIHTINPQYDTTILGFQLQDFRTSGNGPFGLGATLLSLFFPLALALSIGIYYKLRSKNVIKIRNDAKKLEDEFATALFQLGNRLGDGIPAEIAIPKVADVMQESTSGQFFKLTAHNISQGMSVNDALFNTTRGSLTAFPSAVIQSSMKVLIQSIKKGPLIAAQALLNVSRYLKEIHKVNERLKDLMADIISDMKSQIAFLTPAISGIVIGITSMITFILGKLSTNIANLGTQEIGTNIGTLATLFGEGIPTYYFQAVVGIYVFQIVYILTILSNGIENGADKLQERYLLGKNLITSTILYTLISATTIIIFNFIAVNIVGVGQLIT